MMSALMRLVVTLDVTLCVVDLGNYFKKRCWHQTLAFKANCNVDCLFNASCLCVFIPQLDLSCLSKDFKMRLPI